MKKHEIRHALHSLHHMTLHTLHTLYALHLHFICIFMQRDFLWQEHPGSMINVDFRRLELSSFTTSITSQFKSITSQFNRFISRRFNAASMESINFAKLRVSSRMLSSQHLRGVRSFDPKLQHATATDLDAIYRWRRYEPMFPPCPLGSLGDTVKFLNAEQFCSNLGLCRTVWCIMMYIVNSHALSFLLIQNSERCCTSFIVSFIR